MRRILLISLALFGLSTAFAAGTASAALPVPPVSSEDMVLGKADAPITVIEYASLTCPHCADFENNTWPLVKKNWIDTGKIRYVFRDFPLDGLAARAEILAHCGGPTRFFAFIETLYATQDSWATDKDPMAALKRIGLLGGLPGDKFDVCQNDTMLQEKIVAIRQGGEDAGVDATPSFFINGKLTTGAMSYDDFAKLLTDAGKGS
jgi:protein-disulfide isomerase